MDCILRDRSALKFYKLLKKCGFIYMRRNIGSASNPVLRLHLRTKSLQQHFEHRALPGLAFDHHAAAVAVQDMFDKGQTEACSPFVAAFGFIGSIKPFRQTRQMFGGDAGAEIPHHQHDPEFGIC